MLGLAAAALLLSPAGCGNDAGEAPTVPEPVGSEPPPPASEVEPARCPEGLAACTSASGTILYVERVDPDGDGDAHFVLASGESVTAPGITVVDVSADLRPHPLPGPGDRLSAAGTVRPGTYGQRQIEAVVVSVARTSP